MPTATYAKRKKRKPMTAKRFFKKAKKFLLALVRMLARGAYKGVKTIYNCLMDLPPRLLLICGSAFGVLVITIVVIAIASPKKRTNADAMETLTGFVSSEQPVNQTHIDSGTVDPYAEYSPTDGGQAQEPVIFDESIDPSDEGYQETVLGQTAFVSEVAEGHDGAIVAEIQLRLMNLGYMDSDEPTQHFGSLTKSALKAFQRHNGLTTDGICGQGTFNALMSEEAKPYVMQMGDKGEDVEGVQQRLYELGYLDNKANVQGTFGEKTESAAKLFQKKNDLTADGKVGTKTIERLYDEDVVSNAFRLGDENPTIEQCQEALKDLGYLTFKPDGVMGKVTVSAIKAFQRANGLTADGALGPVTRDMLLSGEGQALVVQLGDRGTEVKNIQKRLIKLNYLTSGSDTGYFGEITQDAVKAFQKRAGLTRDGAVGAVTLTMLNSSSAKKASSPVNASKSTDAASSSGSGSSSGGSSTSSGYTPSSGSSSGGSSSGGSTAVVSGTGVTKLIGLAESKLGCKYVRGAKGANTFDCSGFVYWCLKNSGVSVSYMTSIAWRTCSRFQKISSLSSVQAGDILVFTGSTDAAGHVGIYIGGGKMIDASSSEGRVRTSSTVLKSGGYWSNHFVCAYRVF